MKILKLLNKIYFSIIFTIILSVNSFAEDTPIDIWDLNKNATEEEITYEENRFLRAGVVICVISSPVEHKKIPVWEMQLSSAAVCQNLLISAQSLGYAAQWLTEWYTYDEVILKELGFSERDKISGFIYIGKKNEEPKDRIRPEKEKIVSYWN